MNSASACTVCGEAGHRATRCAALHAPLKDGFWAGGNGGGGHGGDEEDDTCRVILHYAASHSGKQREEDERATVSLFTANDCITQRVFSFHENTSGCDDYVITQRAVFPPVRVWRDRRQPAA